MLDNAIQILSDINDLGFTAYIIGGYPRDLYIGIKNDDIDICSNIKEEVLYANFNIISKTQFGSFIIEKNGYEYELTLFRKDEYLDNRYPNITYVDTLKEDLLRRDFTINTLCIDKDKNYVDLMGAINDIDNKIIKVIGNVNTKMKEDPLRIIRAIRFSADLNFKIEESLEKFIKENKDLVNNITNSRLQKELDKVKNKTKFTNLMKELDLIEYIK